MNESTVLPDHERIVIARGTTSDATIIVAVHSTALGPALGGCRLWQYPDWHEALHDALRLSQGMTAKNALCGLPRGGGKAVLMAPTGPLTPELREAMFLDLGDVVDSLGGDYVTAEDVGTSAQDMITVSRRTEHLVGLPTELGGRGDPGSYTARGVLACFDRMLPRLSGGAAGHVAISGLGQVGGSLARSLAARGFELTLSDIDPAKQVLAEELGAAWAEPGKIHRTDADIFMPAGVGGMLTSEVIDTLGARAVLGPANNQLAASDGAVRLARRGILYAPDYVVNAGGVIYLGHAGSTATAIELVDRLGDRLDAVFDAADREGVTPSEAADRLVQRLLSEPRTTRSGMRGH